MSYDPTADTPTHGLYDANGNLVVAIGWDSDTNELVLSHVTGGAEHRLNAAGDYTVDGTISNGDQSFAEGSSMVHDRDEVTGDQTTAGAGYYHVDTDAAGESVTLTLASDDAEEGRELNIKRDGANGVTVDTEGSETIDGDDSIELTSDQESVTLVYNNPDSDWEVW